jgi:hypothetical protein
MSIDFRNNISQQLFTMGCERIDSHKPSKSIELAQKVGLFVSTLFLWIIEKSLREAVGTSIWLVMLPIHIWVEFPTCLVPDIVVKFSQDMSWVHPIVTGTLYRYQTPIGKRMTTDVASSYNKYPYVNYSLYQGSAEKPFRAE